LVSLTENFSDYNFPGQVVTLDQGLTLIHQYLPQISVAVVDVWVRAGAIAEPREWHGMAHFLEHMIFKGTKKIAPGMFDQMIEHKGGTANAATSHDYAHFFLTMAPRYLADTLPYLAEILLQADIPEEEFDRERDVVLEEIRASYDNPNCLAFQNLKVYYISQKRSNELLIYKSTLPVRNLKRLPMINIIHFKYLS